VVICQEGGGEIVTGSRQGWVEIVVLFAEKSRNTVAFSA